MAKDTHERLLEWLGDAHAMEKSVDAFRGGPVRHTFQ